MYDVWVNWFEDAEAGYDVAPFHEWKKTDQIEIVEQIPVLYITEELYDYIENSLGILPHDLLEMIRKRTFIRNNQLRRRIEYAAIVTDGRGILVFHTMGFHVPIKKSRMIPRQEGQIYQVVKNRERLQFHDQKVRSQQERVQTLEKESFMYGLTRRERHAKKILLQALTELQKTNNVSEVTYWLTEWDSSLAATIEQDSSAQAVWQTLFQAVKYGWDERHERFCSEFVKHHKELKENWKLVQIEK